jgi:hypothetical protein
MKKHGRVVDVVRMYIPVHSADDGTVAMTEQQIECYDNIDPEVQARHWCVVHSLTGDACMSLIEIFDRTYYHASEAVMTFEFGGQSFTLYSEFDPYVQASRYCKRHGISSRECEPLITYAEEQYYEYGSVIHTFDIRLPDNTVAPFTLYNKADPIAQADRFCTRTHVHVRECGELSVAASEVFTKAGHVLEIFNVQDPTVVNHSLTHTFTLYSNLDPAVQATHFCRNVNLTEENCDSLIDMSERAYFRAGDIIDNFTYTAVVVGSKKNVSFTLYNSVNPMVQIDRFFKKHSIPQADRSGLRDTINERFYEAAELLSSFNVSIEGVSGPVELHIYDNLDPLLQVRNFCTLNLILPATCEDFVAAAEAIYFDTRELGHFWLSVDAKDLRFNYFVGMTTAQQVERFCSVHDLSIEGCKAVSNIAEEQALEMLANEQKKRQHHLKEQQKLDEISTSMNQEAEDDVDREVIEL